MRHGRAEERHDPVAHDLVHRARVAVDGFHHGLEHRIENPPRVLGIALGEHLHGALEIGEHHGDLLALALELAPTADDPLGQVRWRVDLG